MFKLTGRKIQFYETDLMGIVHHSNYLRLFEEARVAWAVERGLLSYQKPESAFQLAVLETQVRHVQALRFGEEVEIEVQVKQEKLRIVFEYKMYSVTQDRRLMATCRTSHVALDKNMKIMRPPQEMKSILEKEKWIETWL